MSAVGPLEGHLALWKLYVLPAYQGYGVGSRLLDNAIAAARADGYDEVRLSYLDGNTHAGRFYLRHGFEMFDRESSGSGVPDSIWLRLPLLEMDNEESA